MKLLQRKFPKDSLKEWTSKKMWRGRYNSLGRRKRICNNHGGSKEWEQITLQVLLQYKVRRLTLINSILRWESPRQTPGWWFKGTSLRTHSCAHSYDVFSERIQGQSAKKRHQWQSPQKTRLKLPSPLTQSSPASWDTHVKCCLLGKLISAGFLSGGWPHSTPLISNVPQFQTPKNESTCSA